MTKKDAVFGASLSFDNGRVGSDISEKRIPINIRCLRTGCRKLSRSTRVHCCRLLLSIQDLSRFTYFPLFLLLSLTSHEFRGERCEYVVVQMGQWRFHRDVQQERCSNRDAQTSECSLNLQRNRSHEAERSNIKGTRLVIEKNSGAKR